MKIAPGIQLYSSSTNFAQSAGVKAFATDHSACLVQKNPVFFGRIIRSVHCLAEQWESFVSRLLAKVRSPLPDHIFTFANISFDSNRKLNVRLYRALIPVTLAPPGSVAIQTPRRGLQACKGIAQPIPIILSKKILILFLLDSGSSRSDPCDIAAIAVGVHLKDARCLHVSSCNHKETYAGPT